MVIIIVGMAISTVKMWYDGGPRFLSPTIFPSPNPLAYNTNPTNGGDANDFVNNYLITNASEW